MLCYPSSLRTRVARQLIATSVVTGASLDVLSVISFQKDRCFVT